MKRAVLLLVLLAGCSREVRMDENMSGISGPYDNGKTWIRAAKGHEAQGDLQRALFEYRLARTVTGGAADTLQAIERVQKQINSRTAILNRQAVKAAAQGKRSEARELYLSIVGLQPDHQGALAALRKLDESESLRAMEEKVALSKKNLLRSRSPTRKSSGYTQAGDADSQQAIPYAAGSAGDARQLLQSLEKRLKKNPNDKALRRRMVETSLALTEQAYQAEQLDGALSYINKAEQASRKDAAQRQAVVDARKHYARELYNRGVISYRSEPQKALNAWRYALEFDPQNEKSRLRIRSISSM